MDLSAEGLEPSVEAMGELIGLASNRVVRHLQGLDRMPACNESDVGPILEKLREPLPEAGQPYAKLLDLIFDELPRVGINSASGGALSYIHGGGILHGAVADLITGAINPYVAYAGPSPAFAQLEQTVVRWFSDLMGLPASAGGVLLSGGSAANFSAIVTARRALLGEDFRGAVLYASDQVHHSIPKSAMLAGLPSDSMRYVPSDDRGRIDVTALARAIAADRAAGRRPFMIAATAGTTNTGAIDDLPSLADLAAEHGVWFHVDGAYGGLFALTERGRALLRGIERADTIVLNPHKTLFLPFGTGCLLARDAECLRSAHLLHADYIHAAVERSETLGAATANFADLSPELTRSLRGLRVWLPMKLCGASRFREALDEKLDLAHLAFREIGAMAGFSIVTPPSLSTFTFKAEPADRNPEEQDALNRRIMEIVNAKGRVHLSATTLGGRFTLRVCVLSFRTHQSHITSCVADLAEALQESLRNPRPTRTPEHQSH